MINFTISVIHVEQLVGCVRVRACVCVCVRLSVRVCVRTILKFELYDS